MRSSFFRGARLGAPALFVIAALESPAVAQPAEPRAVDTDADARAPPVVTPPAIAPAAAPPPLPAESAPAVEVSPFTGRLFGYIEERVHAVGAEPNGDVHPDGSPARSSPALDLAIPSFHMMGQGAIYSRYRWYFNLAAFDADVPTEDRAVGVRNAWLEASIFGDYLNLRVGKMYRRFGLYNEVLDTVPSFVGIEAPAVFDGERGMLTRTTNVMLHGKASFGPSTVSYAATAGKDEKSANDDVFSPGFDLNYAYDSTILVGTSYYNSGGKVQPDGALGSGSSSGGIAPWMDHDRFSVYGGYAKLTAGNFVLHVEDWIAPHDATRDPAKVLTLAKSAANFSPANRARMGVAGASPTEADVFRDARHTVSAFNARAWYTFEVGHGDDPLEVTPYADFEYVRNLETISDGVYGGDDEAGESPRGIHIHNRIGVVVKPYAPIAFKMELTHVLNAFGNGFVSNDEAWFSLSYAWELVRK